MIFQALRPNAGKKQVASPRPIPAPVEGWDTTTALAVMPQTRAVQLKNWFPQPGWVEMRRGFQSHATGVTSTSTSVESLMAWNGPASAKMFAAGGGRIYDVTVAGSGVSAVTGLSEDRWQSVNVTNSGGNYLYIVNGADAARHYNGSAWATPTITGVSSAALINISLHKRRIWFTEKDSTSAWYLAADAIAGAATEFDVGAEFALGGYLVGTTTWTLDGGTGLDDYMVFLSSKGEVVVYQGTDPDTANTWSKVGTFRIATPIGRRCMLNYGSQPLVITVAGVLQLKLALGVDQTQIDQATITARIMQAMHTAARSYSSNFGWELCAYPAGTRLILNIPTAENSLSKQYVMNSLTGAWCEFDAHNANTWLVFEDRLYFGANNGRVYRADYTSSDAQSPIVAVGQTAYSNPGGGGLKRYTMAKALVYTDSTARVAIGISTDFVETQTISTPSSTVPATAVWDTASWDAATWGGSPIYYDDWTSSPSLGRYASVKFTARTGVQASYWGVASWASGIWGSFSEDQLIQVNGFVVLAETGGVL